MSDVQELDVTKIEPRKKHPTIFETFDALDEGKSFVIVNDHDHAPLRYQFQAERPDVFEWDYIEEGPEVWNVRLTKSS